MRYLATLLFFAISIFSFSQKFKLDSNYVESYKQKFILVFHLSGQYNSLDLSQNDTDTSKANLSFPTFKTSLGFTFNYKWFNFSYGRNVIDVLFKDAFKEQQQLSGQTKITNYKFTYAPNRIRIETYFKKISGFHEENREFYDSTYTAGTPYYQYPEMTTRSFGGDLIWTYNIRNRFSLGAPYSYSTRQNKSAGSFLFYMGVNHFDIRSNSSFIPQPVSQNYGSFDDLKYFKGLSLSAGVGWGYTLVIAKILYANVILIARYPYVMREYETVSGEKFKSNSLEDEPDALSFGIARSAVGINFKSFFASIYAYADLYNYSYYTNRQVSLAISNLNIRGAVNVGFRFNKLKRKQKTKASL